MSTKVVSPNRLAQEKSPYLLQHAHNPVDWYPWGDEAFEKAKRENKMIFLSVGYSTCHWCHVMERESFESADIGKLMNEHFVSIKVDREERPDVDKMYMTFIQAISGGGGWPMSVFLTPDLQPVTGGTYFPPKDQWGRPGFSSILHYVAAQWREKATDVRNQGMTLTDAIKQASKDVANISINDAESQVDGEACVQKCYDQLLKSYDSRFGGFNKEPKFPQPVNLEFLLRYYSQRQDSEAGKKALEMVEKTLLCMSRGGMHDHVGQGFHRYSTDQRWHVPHFEKMLYDQAQLAAVYAEAYQVSSNSIYADMVRDIVEYVERDLSHPEGGFYSAEDADSKCAEGSPEMKEGAFYVWTEEEVRKILREPLTGADKEGKTTADVFCRHYTVRDGGNLHPYADPHGELTNQNVLICFNSEKDTGKEFGLSEQQTADVLAGCRRELFKIRSARPRPHLDTKMITAWNGLMISGLAKAAISLGENRFAERARKTAQFVRKYLTDSETGCLLRSCYTDSGKHEAVVQPKPPIEGFVDDYAFLICGLLDLYESTLAPEWLEWSEQLQQKMDELFWDSEADSGYFMSKAEDKSILVRMKDDQDSAEPSANSVAPLNLIRLGALLGEKGYRERAEKVIRGFSERMNKLPIVLPKMVCAVQKLNSPPVQIVIVGPRSNAETEALLKAANSVFLPEKVLIWLDGETDCWLKNRVEDLRQMEMVEQKPTAFVCRDFACSLPVHNPQDLSAMLDKQQSF